MRVALNYPSIGARRGGAETYVGLLARALVAAGHSVDVFASRVDDGELPHSVRLHRISVPTWPGLGWLKPYHFARQSARALARHDFDVVIGFTHLWRQDVCIALNGCGPAVIEGSSHRKRSLVARALWRTGKRMNLRQRVYQWIDRKQFHGPRPPLVIAPSRKVADEFRHCHGIPSDRITVIPLGIDLTAMPKHPENVRASFRKRLNLAPTDVGLLFAARNYALKGLDPLLEAFALAARSAPNAHLMVCGCDRDRRYRSRVRALGVEHRVSFLGFVDDPRECFAGADVFVLPTFYDACSLVVLEALAAGLPIVTTRCNGASELISEGVEGFVIDSPWNTQQLASRIARLALDGDARRAMSSRARLRSNRLSIEESVHTVLTAVENFGRQNAMLRERKAAA